MRETLRYCHYARSTEKTYCQWILRYIYFFDKKRHPPTVLTEAEILNLLAEINGPHLLMAKLIYRSSIRLMECIQLRRQDINFGQCQIFDLGGKGGKDRVTFLPCIQNQELRLHIKQVKELHRRDLAEGYGKVYLSNPTNGIF
ncbi:phage integrase N-terminal SAM-like domain-containing protein [Desulforhopalus sp. 52FAK]